MGVGHSSVSVAGKRLYTMGNRGGSDVVACLDALTGKLVWKISYACPPGNYAGPRATPAELPVPRSSPAGASDAPSGEACFDPS